MSRWWRGTPHERRRSEQVAYLASLRVGLDSTLLVRDFTDHMGTAKRRWYFAAGSGRNRDRYCPSATKGSHFSIDERFGIHPPRGEEDADKNQVPTVVLLTLFYQHLQVLILIGAIIAGLQWYRRQAYNGARAVSSRLASFGPLMTNPNAGYRLYRARLHYIPIPADEESFEHDERIDQAEALNLFPVSR